MKKTQMALAAVALVASSAALAEVTVFGTLDAGVANSTTAGTQFSGDGGWVAGNVFGVKGSEDLGGGLKANFNLRAGINLGSGGSDNGGNGTLFNQLANVGVSGDFGSVSLGQQFSPFIGAIAGGTAGVGHFFVNRIIMGSGAAGAIGTGIGGQSSGGFFIANAMSYTSPDLGGFSVTALTNGKNGGPNVAGTLNQAQDRYDTVVLNGTLGGGKISLGLEQRDSYRTQLLAASFPIGDLTISGTAMAFRTTATAPAAFTSRNTNVSYSLSAAYAFSDALAGNVQYASGQDTATNTTDQSLLGLGLKYSLSKTTSTYASYTRGTGGIASNYSYRGTTTLGTENNTIAVGVVHSF